MTRKPRTKKAGPEVPAPPTQPPRTDAAPASFSSWRTLKARPPTWIWDGRLLAGSVAVLEGRKGLGKSTLAAAIAAAVTGGMALPDVPTMKPGGVIWLTGEEDISITTMPRLVAMGGDRKRVFSPAINETTGNPTRILLPGQLDLLEAQVIEGHAKLIVIDPLVSALSPGIDICHAQSIRSVLEPLGWLCSRRGCLALILRNLRKGTMGPAIDQGMGAGDVGNYARSVLRVDEDPDDKSRRVLSVVACNQGRPVPSLLYRLMPSGDSTRVKWEGHTELTADELAEGAGDSGERDARADARAYLRDKLSQGERKVKEIEEGADLAGISRGTLRRAKKELGIISTPKGPNEDRYFVWVPPDGGFSQN